MLIIFYLISCELLHHVRTKDLKELSMENSPHSIVLLCVMFTLFMLLNL